MSALGGRLGSAFGACWAFAPAADVDADRMLALLLAISKLTQQTLYSTNVQQARK